MLVLVISQLHPFYYQSSFTRVKHIFDDILDFKMTKMPPKHKDTLSHCDQSLGRLLFSVGFIEAYLLEMYLCKLYETSR